MLVLIATTMAVVGLVTSGANAAGTVHDKAVIDESLNTMQETVELLQDRAEEETDKVKKQEKILLAQSLNETEGKLRKLGDKFYVIDLQKEAVGLGKGFVGPSGKAVDVLDDAVSVGETTVQTVTAITDTATDENARDARTKLWAEVADNKDECEIQIMIAKARQLTKEAKQVKEEATQMADYYRQEEAGQLTSKQVEDKLAEVVKNSEELQDILDNAGDKQEQLDESTNTDVEEKEVDKKTESTKEEKSETKNKKIIKTKSDITGKWNLVEVKGWSAEALASTYPNAYLQFNSDGSGYYYVSADAKVGFTYTQSKENISIVYDGFAHDGNSWDLELEGEQLIYNPKTGAAGLVFEMP